MTQLFPQPTHSNCPFAVMWLYLAGYSEQVVATPAAMPWYVKPWFPWHLGGVRGDRVFHFKYVRPGQPWAPFWFEGSMRVESLGRLRKAGKVVWVLPAWIVTCGLLAMLTVVCLPWMLTAAISWPCWWVCEAIKAFNKRK